MRRPWLLMCLLTALATGCVKKAKYERALDDLFDMTAELSAAKDAVDQKAARIAELEAKLARMAKENEEPETVSSEEEATEDP